MSSRTLAQMLKENAKAHRRARADASAPAEPSERLQQGARGSKNAGSSTPTPSRGYSRDDIHRMYMRPWPIQEYVPHDEPTPPATDIATERAASPPSEIDPTAKESIVNYTDIEQHLKNGTDLREWPASARTFLAPMETLIIRLQYPLGTTLHEVKVPKFPFLAASPLYRHTTIPKLGHLVLCSPGKVQTWAIEWIADWLRSICDPNNDNLDMPFPDTSHYALQLRMTAIELGLSQYVKHIEDAWPANCADGASGFGRDTFHPNMRPDAEDSLIERSSARPHVPHPARQPSGRRPSEMRSGGPYEMWDGVVEASGEPGGLTSCK